MPEAPLIAGARSKRGRKQGGEHERERASASASAGVRKEKCVETLVYKGILYYPTLKSRCGITVPHLFRAKTALFQGQKRCNLGRGGS